MFARMRKQFSGVNEASRGDRIRYARFKPVRGCRKGALRALRVAAADWN